MLHRHQRAATVALAITRSVPRPGDALYLAVVLPRRGGTQHVVGYILWVVISVAALSVTHCIHRHLNYYEAIFNISKTGINTSHLLQHTRHPLATRGDSAPAGHLCLDIVVAVEGGGWEAGGGHRGREDHRGAQLQDGEVVVPLLAVVPVVRV